MKDEEDTPIISGPPESWGKFVDRIQRQIGRGARVFVCQQVPPRPGAPVLMILSPEAELRSDLRDEVARSFNRERCVHCGQPAEMCIDCGVLVHVYHAEIRAERARAQHIIGGLLDAMEPKIKPYNFEGVETVIATARAYLEERPGERESE